MYLRLLRRRGFGFHEARLVELPLTKLSNAKIGLRPHNGPAIPRLVVGRCLQSGPLSSDLIEFPVTLTIRPLLLFHFINSSVWPYPAHLLVPVPSPDPR